VDSYEVKITASIVGFVEAAIYALQAVVLHKSLNPQIAPKK
jgi:hypothetical protein